MPCWPPGFLGDGHAEMAVEAAELALALSTSGPPSLPLFGAAVHIGTVFIGTVPDVGGRMCGISAFGIDVSLLARLAHRAGPGEIIVSAAVYEAAGRDRSGVGFQSFDRKGIDYPVDGLCFRR
jgi:class 3 adenylate cyclase